MLVHVATLHPVIASRIVGNLRRVPGNPGSITVHSHLEDIMPVGTKVEPYSATLDEQVSVDGVIWLARVGFKADGALIVPCPREQVRRGRKTNRGGLRSECRYRVIDVVAVPEFVDVRCLYATRASQLRNLRACFDSE